MNLSGTLAPSDGTLRQLLDATLSAPSRRGVVVDHNRVLLGTVTLQEVASSLGDTRAAAPERVA